ncbi:hypothetical protein ACF2JD_10055 [Aeromonas sp. A-5]|uniref:hypothetical protein n=1 Tax=Aeromonas ichthyocola TaxID=3367746 RepID=UPI0038DE3E4B
MLQMMYTEVAVIIGLVNVLLPIMVLPLYSSIEKLDGRLLEATIVYKLAAAGA